MASFFSGGSIKIGLLGYSLIVAILILVVSFVDYNNLSKINSNYDEIIEHSIKEIELTYGLYIKYTNQAEDIIEYVTEIETEEDNKQEWIDGGKEYDKKWEELLLTKNILDEEESIESIKSRYAEFRESGQRLIVAYESGKDLQGMKSEFKDFDIKTDDFEGELISLIQLNNEHIFESKEESNEIAAAAIRLTLIVSIIAIFFAIAFGIFISRRITKPIGKLSGTVDEVSKGNFDVEVDTKTGLKEINVLADSLNRVMVSMKLAVLRKGHVKTKKSGEGVKKFSEGISKIIGKESSDSKKSDLKKDKGKITDLKK
jgi:methyl-accepting chemotaxis protein